MKLQRYNTSSKVWDDIKEGLIAPVDGAPNMLNIFINMEDATAFYTNPEEYQGHVETYYIPTNSLYRVVREVK